MTNALSEIVISYLSDVGLNGVIRHVHADRLGSPVYSLSTSHALWSLRDEAGCLVASIGQGVFIRR